LRLHAGEERLPAFCLTDDQQQALASLAEAFRLCTGLELRFVPSTEAPPLGAVASYPVLGLADKRLGTLQVISPTRAWRQADHQGVAELGGSVAQLLSELARTQEALWQREAELAVGVPVLPHREGERHLAERLEAILRSGAEAVGCQAAALYLLNADTSQLKVRSVYGLPRERLARPPRSLGGAIADLEALLGHAIVLNDHEQMSLWNIPEPFRAACCLPVSTPTIPLGTIWFFASEARDFSTAELGMLEIVAGRIATELEREALLAEACLTSGERFQRDALSRMIESQLPRLRPLSDRWSVVGWTAARDNVHASFHDWAQTDDAALTIFLGRSLLAELRQQNVDVCDSLLAAIVRASARAFADALDDPLVVLRRSNQLLCGLSPGEHGAELALARLEAQGTIRIAGAGRLQMIRFSSADTFRVCGRTTPAMGGDPDQMYLADEHCLAAGEVLVLYLTDIDESAETGTCPSEMARYVIEQRARTAQEFARRAQEYLEHAWSRREATGGHTSLIAIQRRD
jgi:GAF domain-containing protein